MDFTASPTIPALMAAALSVIMSGLQVTAASSAVPSSAPTPAITLGQTFSLSEGETVIVGETLQLNFSAVIAESRCPTGVQCVWEGNATIALKASDVFGPTRQLCLDSSPRFTTIANDGIYTIELLDLEPYPTTGSRTSEPYRATLVVESIDGTTAADAQIGGCSPLDT